LENRDATSKIFVNVENLIISSNDEVVVDEAEIGNLKIVTDNKKVQITKDIMQFRYTARHFREKRGSGLKIAIFESLPFN